MNKACGKSRCWHFSIIIPLLLSGPLFLYQGLNGKIEALVFALKMYDFSEGSVVLAQTFTGLAMTVLGLMFLVIKVSRMESRLKALESTGKVDAA